MPSRPPAPASSAPARPRRGPRLPLPGERERRDRRPLRQQPGDGQLHRARRRDDTNLVSIPIVGTVTVTGHVFLDLNSNQVDGGAGEPDIANVNVGVTDVERRRPDRHHERDWATGPRSCRPGRRRRTSTRRTPISPPRHGETTTADNTTRVGAAHRTNWVVGYRPAAGRDHQALERRWHAASGPARRLHGHGHEHDGDAQTNVNLADILPPGTTLVPGTAGVVSQTNSGDPGHRVLPDGAGADACTEAGTDFAGTVMHADPQPEPGAELLRDRPGFRGRQRRTGGRTPTTSPSRTIPSGRATSAAGSGERRSASPAAPTSPTGRVSSRSSSASRRTARPTRTASSCSTVENLTLPAAGAPTDERTDTTWAGSWGANPPTQLMLVGGANGAGCLTTDATAARAPGLPPAPHALGHEHDQLDPQRDRRSPTTRPRPVPVMAVQWGSAWTVQRTAIVNGNAGGDGLNVVGEYNTAAISPGCARADVGLGHGLHQRRQHEQLRRGRSADARERRGPERRPRAGSRLGSTSRPTR